jgi:hypothetical protein
MKGQLLYLCTGVFALSASVAAQTTVTTSGGTTGQIPYFTGSSTVANSVITQSGGKVGIGTTAPTSDLSVNSGSANYNPTLTYLSTAAWSLQTAEVELAAGVDSSGPYAYWLQARSSLNQAWTMSLNPVGGNVGIGTITPGASLEVNGNVKLTSGSGASITFQDGTTQTTAYTGVSCGGDFAESVDVTGDRHRYEPGDLLTIDPKAPGKFLEAAQPYSTLVAGIYSTKPGYVGRRLSGPKSPDEVPLAMVGIVPTNVTTENGPIHTGDLLVASSTLGRAMKGTDPTRLTGAVVGKALGDLDSGTGVIEVLVTLQ